MSEFVEETSRPRQNLDSFGVEVSLSTRVVVLHPGESFEVALIVNDSRRFVRIEFRYAPSVDLESSPRMGYTPLNASLRVTTMNDASPGVYPVEILVTSIDKSLLASEKLVVVILDRTTRKSIVKHVPDILQVTGELGMQGLFWYVASYIYPEGARFSQIHALHKLMAKRDVSSGTTGNILAYMVRKKILKRENGIYKSLISDLDTLKSRIDKSRIRLQQIKNREAAEQKKDTYVPQQVYWAYDRARRIKKKHGLLAATYFLAYTLLGLRQTGFPLLWINGWFVYCENKTGFCHHFTSPLLSRYFKNLGLQEGIIYSQEPSHEDARKKAQKYIKKYYRSFRTARRLHYLLKEKGFINYENQEVYTLELLYYNNNSIGVRIWDEQKRTLLEKIGVKNCNPTKAEYRTAFPEEHIYKPNEDTYFYRSL